MTTGVAGRTQGWPELAILLQLPAAVLVIQPSREPFQALLRSGTIPTGRELQTQLNPQQIHRQTPGFIGSGLIQGELQQLVGPLGILVRQQVRGQAQPARRHRARGTSGEQHRRSRQAITGSGLVVCQLIQPVHRDRLPRLGGGRRSLHQLLLLERRQIAVHQAPQGSCRPRVVQGRIRRLPTHQQPAFPWGSNAWAVTTQHRAHRLRRTTGHQNPGVGQHHIDALGRRVEAEQTIPQLLLTVRQPETGGLQAALLQGREITAQQQFLKQGLSHGLRLLGSELFRRGRCRSQQQHHQSEGGGPHGGLRSTKEPTRHFTVRLRPWPSRAPVPTPCPP